MKLVKALLPLLSLALMAPVKAQEQQPFNLRPMEKAAAAAASTVSLVDAVLQDSTLLPNAKNKLGRWRRHRKHDHKKDDVEPTLHEGTVTARFVSSTKLDDLSGRQLAYMEDELLVSYNQVNKDNDDYQAMSARLVAQGDEDEASGSQGLLRRGQRRGYAFYYFGFTCKYCGDSDDRLLLLQDKHHMDEWEDKFCAALRESGYFQDLAVCTLRLDTSGADAVAMTTTAEGWSA